MGLTVVSSMVFGWPELIISLAQFIDASIRKSEAYQIGAHYSGNNPTGEVSIRGFTGLLS